MAPPTTTLEQEMTERTSTASTLGSTQQAAAPSSAGAVTPPLPPAVTQAPAETAAAPQPAQTPTPPTVAEIQAAIQKLNYSETAQALKAIAGAETAETTAQAVLQLGFAEGTPAPDLTHDGDDRTVRQAAAYHLIAANIDAKCSTSRISDDENAAKLAAVLNANNSTGVRTVLNTSQVVFGIDFKAASETPHTQDDHILSDRQATALQHQLARRMLSEFSPDQLTAIANAADIENTKTKLGDSFPTAIKDSLDGVGAATLRQAAAFLRVKAGLQSDSATAEQLQKYTEAQDAAAFRRALPAWAANLPDDSALELQREAIYQYLKKVIEIANTTDLLASAQAKNPDDIRLALNRTITNNHPESSLYASAENLSDENAKKLQQAATAKFLELKIAEADTETLKAIASATDEARTALNGKFDDLVVDANNLCDDAAQRLQQQAVIKFLRSSNALVNLSLEQLWKIINATTLQDAMAAFDITCTVTGDQTLLEELKQRAHASANAQRINNVTQTWRTSHNTDTELSEITITDINLGAVDQSTLAKAATVALGESAIIPSNRIKTTMVDHTGQRLPRKHTVSSQDGKTLLEHEIFQQSNGHTKIICRAKDYETGAKLLKALGYTELTLDFTGYPPEAREACLTALHNVFGEKNVHEKLQGVSIPVVQNGLFREGVSSGASTREPSSSSSTSEAGDDSHESSLPVLGSG